MSFTVFEDVDPGPWKKFHNSDGKLVGIISDDFKHDVVLFVNGDFGDPEEYERYCELLIAKLNNTQDDQADRYVTEFIAAADNALTTEPVIIPSRIETADGFVNWVEDWRKSQTRLPREFEEILHDNLDKLYETDKGDK